MQREFLGNRQIFAGSLVTLWLYYVTGVLQLIAVKRIASCTEAGRGGKHEAV